VGQIESHAPQLGVVASDLLQARLHVPDIGDLAAQMEVHQTEDVLSVEPLELVEEPHQLDCGEPEFGALPAALGPAARALGGQLDTHSGGRLDAHITGYFEQHVQLVELLQDHDHRVPQLLAHESEAHELLVLVPVADDEMAGVLVQAQHCLKLRLAAALETDTMGSAEFDDLLHHVALLIDLDRIDGGIGPGVAEFLDGVLELTREGLDARAKDVREAEQEGKADALGLKVERQIVEIQTTFPVGIGVHGDVPVRTHAEVTQTPTVHVVQLLCVLRGPSWRCNSCSDRAAPAKGEAAIVMRSLGEGKRCRSSCCLPVAPALHPDPPMRPAAPGTRP
jgi:hypothetical protein